MKNAIVILVLITVVAYLKNSSPPIKVIEPVEVVRNSRVPEFRLRIAVMDTGLSPFQLNKPYMCKDKTFINDENIAHFDRHGHGTNVVGLIGNAIDNTKYCITSYGIHDYHSMQKYLSMLEKLGEDKPHAINLSWAEEGYNGVEYDLLRKYAEDEGIIVIVAAGNVAAHMTEKKCDTWPACHGLKIKKNFYVIGSPNKRYSNRGDFVHAYYPGDKQGFPVFTGTSQSAANFTGKLFSK